MSDNNAATSTTENLQYVATAKVDAIEESRHRIDQRDAGPPSVDDGSDGYLHGTRLIMVLFAVFFMLFIVQIESTIVSPSLVTISHELGGFDSSSWVVSSYLLGFVGFVVIIAKLSDIFGRKCTTVTCLVLFTAFSGGCGASQSMSQLITMRTLQGIGGGGCFALSTVLLINMVPRHKYTRMAGFSALVAALALPLGPILGSVICQMSSWRWIFLLNVPIGILSLALLIAGLPNGFPHHNKAKIDTEPIPMPVKRVDFLGCLLLLLASTSFTIAFQEANLKFSWDSAYFITLVTVSGIFWCGLLWWEHRVTIQDNIREPVLPWRLFTDPARIGSLLGMTMAGGPIIVCTFQLPQRFQIVHGRSIINAGVQLLPFSAAVPIGTVVGTILIGKIRVPYVYSALFGSLLQVLGYGLLSSVKSASSTIPHYMYGYEVLAGFGGGVNLVTFLATVPTLNERRDHAVAVGVMNQFRSMGGALVLAIASSLFNSLVFPMLRDLGIMDAANFLTADFNRHFSSTKSEETIVSAKKVLSDGYNRQMILLCACGVVQIGAALVMWKKPQLRSPNRHK